MKVPRRLILAIPWAGTAALVPLCAAEPQSNTKSKLAGVWVAEKVISSGTVVPSDEFPFELIFEKDKLIFRFVAPVKGDDQVNKIKVDDKKDPATLDITSEDPRRKETVFAIYKFENEQLFIYSLRDKNGQPSPDRPAAFGTGDEKGADLLILKRKPKQTQESPNKAVNPSGGSGGF